MIFKGPSRVLSGFEEGYDLLRIGIGHWGLWQVGSLEVCRLYWVSGVAELRQARIEASPKRV